MRLDRIDAAMLNEAVAIYLRLAYDNPADRERRAVRFDPGLPVAEALNRFEREGEGSAAYTLRLGSRQYPHMKLALWEAYFRDEFVFAVDRHDGVDLALPPADLEAWLSVKSDNYRTKAAIEEAWRTAGLPTLRGLKEERLSTTDVFRVFAGHTVLLVENDPDAAAIVELILRAEGYRVRRAASVREAREAIRHPDGEHCGLALVDLLLADGTGREVVRALRATPATQDIPILLTSAMRDAEASVPEIDGCLRKPFEAGELLAAVALALRRHGDGHEMRLDKPDAGRR